jgi:antitoxin (DNA-binding transcriptional repressor) of toxin-antitoxin stability system
MATLLALVERGETVVITDGRGHPAAAVVPFEVLAELSRLRDAEEDRQDAAAIDAAEAEMERTGEQPVPWSVMEAELDALRDAEDAA